VCDCSFRYPNNFKLVIKLGFPFFPAFQFPEKREIFIKFFGNPKTQWDSGKSEISLENFRDSEKIPKILFFYILTFY